MHEVSLHHGPTGFVIRNAVSLNPAITIVCPASLEQNALFPILCSTQVQMGSCYGISYIGSFFFFFLTGAATYGHKSYV